jgi:cobalamin biosynthesis protein CobD/CbiB
MPPWVPPFLAGSVAIVLLWVALALQRLLEHRRHWARRLERDLRRWDGRLGDELDRG